MRIRDVADYETRLDNLFKQFGSLPADNELLQAHWSRYLCVLVSGYIETSVRAILADYVRRQSSPTVNKYVSGQLESFQNAKPEKIYNLVGSFSEDWKNSLETQTEGRLKDAINSVVSNRHQIAHGRNSGISFVVIKGYYESSKEFIEILTSICQ